MSVFVFLGCGTPLQMTSLGRWRGLQMGDYGRRQAREKGSGEALPTVASLAGTCPSLGIAGQPVYLVTNTSVCQEEPSSPLLSTDTSAPGGRENKGGI